LGLLFVIVQVIAITIAPIYSEAETEALGGEREPIENPGFSFIYLGIILLFTFVILWIAKRKKERFIKGLILAAIFMTMIYLFIPITIIAMYPPAGDGWGSNEIDVPVVVLNAGDIDNDGIVEIVAGCADNRIRVYESENHTLEWESDELDANITQILIANLDGDAPSEVVVLSQGFQVFNGRNGSLKWGNSSENITAITANDLNGNGTVELIVGTDDARVLIIESGGISDDIDMSLSLDSIEFLDTTDDSRLVAADNSTMIVLNPSTSGIDLEIEEMVNITALTVYKNPDGEDSIVVSGTTMNEKGEEVKGRTYLYDFSNITSIRKSPKFGNTRAIYLEHYSIPGYNDSIPDVIVFGEETIYISPDLLKSDDHYYFLNVGSDSLSLLSTDVEGDGENELFVGYDDGYIYTPIGFEEGPSFLIPIIISILIALSLTLLVHKFPEWYVVDGVGLVMAIGATVILGVTFAILPAIVLLIVLGIYDAISVYKTKHMISLADSVMDLNLPVLLVVPKKLGYSYRKQKPRLKEQLDEGTEREAMFMGLGDIVIPG
jgi:presenilin-like A22 family membrane protease